MMTRRRVRRGMRFLDQVKPGWELMINLDTLNAKDRSRSILGQLYQDHSAGLFETGLTTPKARALALKAYSQEDYARLNVAWRQQIRVRLERVETRHYG